MPRVLGLGLPRWPAWCWVLLVHSGLLQSAVLIPRMTTSYRALELGVPVGWLGAVAATFALAPLLAGAWSGLIAEVFGVGATVRTRVRRVRAGQAPAGGPRGRWGRVRPRPAANGEATPAAPLWPRGPHRRPARSGPTPTPPVTSADRHPAPRPPPPTGHAHTPRETPRTPAGVPPPDPPADPPTW